MSDVKLPALAEGVTKANISYWHKQPGDTVTEGEDLVELVTHKATFNMPVPFTGQLTSVLASEGDEVSVGQVIARIE